VNPDALGTIGSDLLEHDLDDRARRRFSAFVRPAKRPKIEGQ
jgi:inhibitor of KinA sporulation pathway (predicted exonuclease)